MISCEGIGKGIEKAIEDALFQLKAPREDVDIKILEEGGLFKKSKVLVTISDDCLAKYEKKTNKIDDEVETVLDVKELLSNNVEEKPKVEKPKVEKPKVEKPKVEEKPFVKVERETSDIKSVNFLNGLLDLMKINGEVEVSKNEEAINIEVKNGNASEVIGYRGECLNAVQYLLNVVEARSDGDKERVILDVENYREKREETLVNLAKRMARKVAKTNHQVKLEPMNANERRIIHTTLQDDASVTTISKGNEPNRYLTIIPRKKADF